MEKPSKWEMRRWVKNTDRWDFALLKLSSVAANGTLILTSSDEEKIALFHVTEESRATGMAGARSSKISTKVSFYLSSFPLHDHHYQAASFLMEGGCQHFMVAVCCQEFMGYIL